MLLYDILRLALTLTEVSGIHETPSILHRSSYASHVMGVS